MTTMMNLFFGLTLIIFALCYDSSASSAFPNQKFETWFGTYARHFEKSSMITCNSTLQHYRNHRSDLPIPEFAVAHHADCILANTTETIKANMASAGVVLGLMPSLLSSLGPTLAESSKLALERPFLSLLLAVGAPVFYPFRTFDDQHPSKALKQPFKMLMRISSSRWPYTLISLLQYLLALAAAINVIVTSLQLGLKTVVTWKKNQSYLPLMWVVLPLAIHLCAAIRLLLVVKRVQNHLRYFLKLLMSTSRKILWRRVPEPVHRLPIFSRPKHASALYMKDITIQPKTRHFWHIFLARCYRSQLGCTFLQAR